MIVAILRDAKDPHDSSRKLFGIFSTYEELNKFEYNQKEYELDTYEVDVDNISNIWLSM